MRRTVFVIAAVLFCTAFGRVLYVHPDSTQNCIQDCLDSCAAGDTVLVGAGTYTENISWPRVQGVKLLSEYDRDTTTIDGGGVDRVINLPYSVDTTTVVSGFTITNGYAEYGAGVRCDSNASPLIADNRITLNIAYGTTYGHGGGVGLVYGASPVIRGNIISRNRATGTWSGGGGIMVIDGCAPLIQGNTIEGNWSSAGGGGVFCNNQSAAKIIGNTIRYDTSGASGAGVCSQRAATFVYGNTIAYNYASAYRGGGVWAGVNDVSTIRGNTIEWNVALDGGGGVACGDNSLALIDSNEIRQNQTFASGGGILVSADAHPRIERNDITHNTAPFGGGIACYYGSHPQIVDNRIVGNTADSLGGGIEIYVSSSPTLRGDSVAGNQAVLGGGIACLASCSPLIESCYIRVNTGGGVYCDSASSPTIEFSNIEGNSPYGVRNVDKMLTVLAEHNWWGDPSGPYHPDSNPGGLGDTVSDYVDFVPWESLLVSVREVSRPRGDNRRSPAASIAREVLVLGAADSRQQSDNRAELLDVSGRKVANLVPGANDARAQVSHVVRTGD